MNSYRPGAGGVQVVLHRLPWANETMVFGPRPCGLNRVLNSVRVAPWACADEMKAVSVTPSPTLTCRPSRVEARVIVSGTALAASSAGAFV